MSDEERIVITKPEIEVVTISAPGPTGPQGPPGEGEGAAVAAEAVTREAADDAEREARESADGILASATAAAKATADAALPKSGGTMTGALTLAGDAATNLEPVTKQQLTAAINALVNGAPEALDTLKEISERLGLDESAEATLIATVATKLAKSANLSDLVDAVAARGNLGLGTAATHPATDFDAAGAAAGEETRAKAAEALKLAKASNLSDVASASTARTNLGLGTSATKDSGAAGEAGKVLAADDSKMLSFGTRVEPHTFPIAAPTAGKIGAFFVPVLAGETVTLKGVRYVTDSGTCKLKVKRKTSGGVTTEPLKEKEAKAEAQEQTPATALANNDYLSLEVESIAAPTFLVVTFFIEIAH